MTDQPAPIHRYRLSYARGTEMRFVSTLDMQLVWERTMRRARLPVAYTQGFSPRPRFHMAAALPLGFTSRCEIADVWLNGAFDESEMAAKIQAAAPPGMGIQGVQEVDLSLPALQTQVNTAEYRVEFIELPADFDLTSAVKDLLAASTLPRTRRDKPYDLRLLIEALEVLPVANMEGLTGLWMRLSAREGATGRPEEVLSALGLNSTLARVVRVRLNITGA